MTARRHSSTDTPMGWAVVGDVDEDGTVGPTSFRTTCVDHGALRVTLVRRAVGAKARLWYVAEGPELRQCAAGHADTMEELHEAIEWLREHWRLDPVR